MLLPVAFSVSCAFASGEPHSSYNDVIREEINNRCLTPEGRGRLAGEMVTVLEDKIKLHAEVKRLAEENKQLRSQLEGRLETERD